MTYADCMCQKDGGRELASVDAAKQRLKDSIKSMDKD